MLIALRTSRKARTLQPTPFVTSKLHSTKSGVAVTRVSEFPCAIVVSAIASGAYAREYYIRYWSDARGAVTLIRDLDCRFG
jgi:hypothetical protein